MSSGGRLSSVVSGSLGLATFLTSRTLRMETPVNHLTGRFIPFTAQTQPFNRVAAIS